MIDKYIVKGGKKLRYGYTTGTCAASAAKACAIMIFGQKDIESVAIDTPKGFSLNLDVYDIKRQENSVSCGIKKDSGDDPDITNGMMIYAKVTLTDTGFNIHGGVGIGTVTKKGLAVEVGKSAINPAPLAMIKKEVLSVSKKYGVMDGFDIEIFAPQGEQLAKKTFNSKLGIVGGLSILGTSGIVEPMSEEALKQSLYVELDILKANGQDSVILHPGNYGYKFAADTMKLDMKKSVKVSNYIGDMVDAAQMRGFKKILFVSHIGKAIKVAGGMMDTHSKHGDNRIEMFVKKAVLAGCNQQVIDKIGECVTTESVIDIIKDEVQYGDIISSILADVIHNLSDSVDGKVEISAALFSSVHGLLAKSDIHKEFYL